MALSRFRLAVVMEKRLLSNRWQSEQWFPVEARPDSGDLTAPRRLDTETERWIYPGFNLDFFSDEAEGYFLNLSAEHPFLFIMWRMENELAVPCVVTASYNEASRMLDAGEAVEGLPMPAEIRAVAEAFTLEHYKPERKQRARAPSFAGARRDP